MSSDEIQAMVTTLRAGIDALFTCDLASLSTAQLDAGRSALDVLRLRLEQVQQALLAEVIASGVAAERGYTSTADLLVDLLHITPSEAKARVRRASELEPVPRHR